MIKEATASVFVFRQEAGGGQWLVALVDHPRLGEWMPPGGHVEPYESAAEAAVREVREEAGLAVRLLPGPTVPLPASFPHPPVKAPWWVVQMRVSPDRHTAGPHVHLDHVYVAVADDDQTSAEPGEPDHRVAWFTAREIATAARIAEDSRSQAKQLFAALHGVIHTVALR